MLMRSSPARAGNAGTAGTAIAAAAAKAEDAPISRRVTTPRAASCTRTHCSGSPTVYGHAAVGPLMESVGGLMTGLHAEQGWRRFVCQRAPIHLATCWQAGRARRAEGAGAHVSSIHVSSPSTSIVHCQRPTHDGRQRASVDILWVDAELRGAPGSLGGSQQYGSREKPGHDMCGQDPPCREERADPGEISGQSPTCGCSCAETVSAARLGVAAQRGRTAVAVLRASARSWAGSTVARRAKAML